MQMTLNEKADREDNHRAYSGTSEVETMKRLSTVAIKNIISSQSVNILYVRKINAEMRETGLSIRI